jgi:hypothetical protein
MNNKEEKHHHIIRVLVGDAKYGSTERVAQWIAEEIAEREPSDTTVEVKNISHIVEVNYDRVVIGSPIYDDEPLNSVIAFLDVQSDALEHVNVALFVVCGHYGALPKDKLINMYVKKLEAHISGTVVGGRSSVAPLTSRNCRMKTSAPWRISQRGGGIQLLNWICLIGIQFRHLGKNFTLPKSGFYILRRGGCA